MRPAVNQSSEGGIPVVGPGRGSVDDEADDDSDHPFALAVEEVRDALAGRELADVTVAAVRADDLALDAGQLGLDLSDGGADADSGRSVFLRRGRLDRGDGAAALEGDLQPRVGEDRVPAELVGAVADAAGRAEL